MGFCHQSSTTHWSPVTGPFPTNEMYGNPPTHVEALPSPVYMIQCGSCVCLKEDMWWLTGLASRQTFWEMKMGYHQLVSFSTNQEYVAAQVPFVASIYSLSNMDTSHTGPFNHSCLSRVVVGNVVPGLEAMANGNNHRHPLVPEQLCTAQDCERTSESEDSLWPRLGIGWVAEQSQGQSWPTCTTT